MLAQKAVDPLHARSATIRRHDRPALRPSDGGVRGRMPRRSGMRRPQRSLRDLRWHSAECRLPRLAGRRAVRHARGAREPRRAARAPDHADRRGTAGEHAFAASRSAVRARRRTGPGGDLPRPLRGADGRRAQGPRHHPRRSARNRPLVAALAAVRCRQDETLGTAVNIDIVPRAADCAKELAALGIDPAQYTTAAWVEDLDAVRAELGYAKINLWGGSYGTRVALEYLRRHPDRVRSAVLDGVAPPAMIVSFDVWPARDRAIDRIIEGCKTSPPCRTAHPDLAATLGSIRARLGAAGRDVSVTDPRTGAVETLHVTFDHVVAALQPLTYVPELAALIPEVIGARGRGGLRAAVRSGVARDGQPERADERRAPLLGDVRRGRAAPVAGRRAQCARRRSFGAAGPAPARRVRGMAARHARPSTRRRPSTATCRC